jgi:glycosyltransferase involved in cell wall biosynthesis
MNVLLATEAYWPTVDGGSNFERRLVKGLRALGHDVRVIAPQLPGIPTLDETDGYPIYRPNSWPAPFVGSYRFAYRPDPLVKQVFADFKPDVVHIHNPYLIGRAAMRAAKRAGVPVIATNHLMPENIFYNVGFGPLKNVLSKAVWHYLISFHNRADLVTSPSQTALQMLLDHGLTVPSHAVSNGIDLNNFKPNQDASKLREKLGLPDKPIVLYAGRLDREKRIDVWIHAIPEVLKTVDAHFVIVGRGNDRKRAENLVRTLGLEAHVTFPGFLEEQEFPLVYNLASVFAISSPAELQSIVTLEAIASGLPVVAVEAGALPELVHEGENGRLTRPGDSTEFGQAITEVLKDPKRAIMGEASRGIAEGHDNAKMVTNYLELYTELMNGKSV